MILLFITFAHYKRERRKRFCDGLSDYAGLESFSKTILFIQSKKSMYDSQKYQIDIGCTMNYLIQKVIDNYN